MASVVGLRSAASELGRTFRRLKESQQHPSDAFFFFVGAGISAPQVPLATALEEEWRGRVARDESFVEAPPGPESSPMTRYSFWLRKAYSQPIERQRYFRELIEGTPISSANLRLGHLLLSGAAPTLVVTPNFDDFLSRALTLFGKPHISCDHPATAQRIDPERLDVQVLHVHGTYWYYDLKNLTDEVVDRARPGAVHQSIASRLDMILANRSPIILGYSGWEEDVFMSALRRRLEAHPLSYNLYWFCYRRDDAALLPSFLRDHGDVVIVVPDSDPAAAETDEPDVSTRPVAGEAQAGKMSAESSSKERGTLPATAVLDALIQTLDIEAPPLTQNPLTFYAGQLRRLLTTAETPRADAAEDTYRIASIVERLDAMASSWAPEQAEEVSPDQVNLEGVRDALRRSRYAEAIEGAKALDLTQLTGSQLAEVAEVGWIAATGLLDDSDIEMAGYDVAVDAVDLLREREDEIPLELRERSAKALRFKAITLATRSDPEQAVATYDRLIDRYGDDESLTLREEVAAALANKGIALGTLGHEEEAIAVYEQVIDRYGKDESPALREQVAMALRNKGVTLGRLGSDDGAVVMYEQVVERYGDDDSPAVREQVVGSLRNKGVALGGLGRDEDAVIAFEQVIDRYGDDDTQGIREEVAAALVNKGVALSRLGRDQDAVAAYEQLIDGYSWDDSPAVREQVAAALVKMGVALSSLGRDEEEVAAYEQVIERYGDDESPALREQVAMAFRNKGVAVGSLDRNDEAVGIYELMIDRYGGDETPAVREQVAKAYVNKGVAFDRLDRDEDAVIAYDQLIDRFGEDDSPAIREQVALALRNKGVALASLGRGEEAVAVYALVDERFAEDESPAVREHVAAALTNSGGVLRSLGREEEAVAAYEQVVERYGGDDLAGIQGLVASAREGLEPAAAEDAPGEPG